MKVAFPKQIECTTLTQQCGGRTTANPRVYLGTESTGASRLSNSTKTTTKKNTINTARRTPLERPVIVILNFEKLRTKRTAVKQTPLNELRGVRLQINYVMNTVMATINSFTS